MKIFATLLVMMTVASVAWGDTSIYWLNPTHDFGAFKEDSGNVTCVFKGVNVSGEPVSIVSARATCGCTTPKYSHYTFAPGDTLKVTVSYNPVGRPGRFAKKVYIKNSNDEGQAELMVKGVVIGNEATLKNQYPVDLGKLRLQNEIVTMGELSKGKDKGVYITAYNQTLDTIAPEIKGVPSYMRMSILPAVIPPGEQATIAVHFLGRECDKWGFMQEKITLIPDCGETPHEMEVVMNVLPDFSRLTPGERMNAPVMEFENDRVAFPVMTREGEKVTMEAVVRNEGKNTLEIYRAYSLDEGIEVSVEKSKIKGGKSGKVYVTVDPSEISDELLNATVTLVVNDPSNPQARLRVVGEVRE